MTPLRLSSCVALLALGTGCEGEVGDTWPPQDQQMPSTLGPEKQSPLGAVASAETPRLERLSPDPTNDDAGEPPDASTPVRDAGYTPDAGHLADGGILFADLPFSCSNNRTTPAYDAGPMNDAGWLFCEDFEGGALDGGRWKVTQTQATVTLDSSHSASGARSLHVHVEPLLASSGFIDSLARFPLGGHDTFVRAYVYVETPLDHHAAIFKLMQKYRDGFTFELLKQNAGLTFYETWYDLHGEPDKMAYTTDVAPVGRWSCWEWEVASTNEIHFWLDGVEQGGLHIAANAGWLAPVDSNLGVGWDMYHLEPSHPNGFDVWLDDVVWSRERVGCN